MSGATSRSSSRDSRPSMTCVSAPTATRRRSGSPPDSLIEPTSVGGSESDFGTADTRLARGDRDTLRAFASAGFTNIELIVWPTNVATVDAMAPVIELLDAD